MDPSAPRPPPQPPPCLHPCPCNAQHRVEPQAWGVTGKFQCQAKSRHPQNMVPHCRQPTHPESTRLEWPQGWLSRSLHRSVQPVGLGRHRLCQRVRSPQILAHPESSGKTLCLQNVLRAVLRGAEEQDRRMKGPDLGNPGRSASPRLVPGLRPPPTLTSPLQKQYMMATKNPYGQRYMGSGPRGCTCCPSPAPRCPPTCPRCQALARPAHLEGVEEHLVVHLDLPERP